MIEHVLGTVAVPDAVRGRIVEAAEGNPLFVEQLVSMLVDERLLVLGRGRLARDERPVRRARPARVDRGAADRAPRAAGRRPARRDRACVGDRAELHAPGPERARRRRRPARGQLAPDDAHPEAARSGPTGRPRRTTSGSSTSSSATLHTTACSSATRANLHERFANWAEQVNRDRQRETEYEEILGYHLEQAYRYLFQLGPIDDHARTIGERAAAKLAATGRRAFERGDMAAAANLLERATSLLEPLDPRRLALFPELGEALLQIGEFAHAESLLQDAVATAEVANEQTLAANAELVRMLVVLLSGDSAGWEAAATKAAEDAIELCERAGDDVGLARAWRLLAWMHGQAFRLEETARSLEQAIECARRRRRPARAARLDAVRADGRLRADAGRRRHPSVHGDRRARERRPSGRGGDALRPGAARRMQYEFDGARELYTRARAMFEELGLHVDASTLCLSSAHVELLAGNPEAAERELRRGYDHLAALGERYLLSSVAGLLAEALVDAGRFEEAEDAALATEELADESDIDAQSLWRTTRAKILARQRVARRGRGAGPRGTSSLLAPTDGVVTKVAAAATSPASSSSRAVTKRRWRSSRTRGRMAERKGSRVMVDRLDELAAEAAGPARSSPI